MRFMVSRTSHWSDEGPPCEGAVRKSYTRVDRRSASRPNKIPAYANRDESWWYEEGRNHRVVNRQICRDFDAEGWFIDFPDLAALTTFIGANGHVVIGPSYSNPDILEVEIYDDYRE